MQISRAYPRRAEQALRHDLLALVGKRLDSGDADKLQERLKHDLPGYDVSRRIERGSEPGRIRLVDEARRRKPRWLRFEPLRSNVIPTSDHGWGSYIDFNIGKGAHPVHADLCHRQCGGHPLLRNNSGFGLRFESRKLGAQGLGESLAWIPFDQDWQAATLDAVALDPGIRHRNEQRLTITPLLKFAFSPHLSIAAGVSISELEPFPPATDSQMANAAVASVEYNGLWKDSSDATRRHGGRQLRRASRVPRARQRFRVHEGTGGRYVLIRLRTAPRAGGRHGRKDYRRRAALRTVHAR